MKTEALDDKLAEKLAEVKFETLVTLPCEKKAEALMDTVADRLTGVEIVIFGETVAQRYAERVSKNWLTG